MDGYTLDGETVAGSITELEPEALDCRNCPLGAAFDFWNDPGEDLYEEEEK